MRRGNIDLIKTKTCCESFKLIKEISINKRGKKQIHISEM